MRKVLFLAVLAVFILTGCHAPVLSFHEVTNIPGKIENKIKGDYRLKLVNDEKSVSYILFQSNGKAEASMETEGKTVIIKFEEGTREHTAVQTYVYQLTMDSGHDTIEVFINGESVPFDVVES